MLQGKRIIVTGAAQGIGAVLADGFSKMGARVSLADIADPSEAVAKITDAGGQAIGVTMDVTRLEDNERMVAETEDAFGGVDGLVCNAALFATLPIQMQDEIDPELWEHVVLRLYSRQMPPPDRERPSEATGALGQSDGRQYQRKMAVRACGGPGNGTCGWRFNRNDRNQPDLSRFSRNAAL